MMFIEINSVTVVFFQMSVIHSFKSTLAQTTVSLVDAFMCFEKSPVKVYANLLFSTFLVDFLDSIKQLSCS